MTSGNFADHSKRRRRLDDVGTADGIAIHGRDGGWRLGALGNQILGQNAAERIAERNLLGRQRNSAGNHFLQRVSDRQQRHGYAPAR